MAHFIVPMLACVRQAQLLHSDAVAPCRLWLPCNLVHNVRHAAECRCFCNMAHLSASMLACIRQAQLVHIDAVARRCKWLPLQPGNTIGGAFGLYSAMLRHAVACGYFCNTAHFIVHMLACMRQAHLAHSDVVARCRMWLPLQPGTQLIVPLARTATLRQAVANGCLCNIAHFIVPMLTCIGQAQLVHSDAVARCRKWLPVLPGTRALGLHTQRCRGTLQHAVALATWLISACLCWLATSKRSLHTAMLLQPVACGCPCNLVHNL